MVVQDWHKLLNLRFEIKKWILKSSALDVYNLFDLKGLYLFMDSTQSISTPINLLMKIGISGNVYNIHTYLVSNIVSTLSPMIKHAHPVAH